MLTRFLRGQVLTTTLIITITATVIPGVGASPCRGDGAIPTMATGMADVIHGMVTMVVIHGADIITAITMAGTTVTGMAVADITLATQTSL